MVIACVCLLTWYPHVHPLCILHTSDSSPFARTDLSVFSVPVQSADHDHSTAHQE